MLTNDKVNVNKINAVNIYLNKLRYFQTGGWGWAPGAPVLDPSLTSEYIKFVTFLENSFIQKETSPMKCR